MRIVLMQDSAPRLEAPEDFKRFSIALDSRLRASAAAAIAPVGCLDPAGGTHAWIRLDAVKALSPMAGDPAWAARFDAMCGFAANHGWIAEDGSIRAHIDYVEIPEAVSQDDFRNAMRKFASGICIVACGQGETRCGMTVSAFASVSAEPPMVLVCLSRNAHCHETLLAAGSYSVNILGGSQERIARIFAGQCGLHGAERFMAADWREGPHGAPVLVDAHQSLVCVPIHPQRAGSHTVLIGQVVSAPTAQETDALVNYDGQIRTTAPQPAAA